MVDAVQHGERPVSPEARLEIARSLESAGRHQDAMLAYYRAIIEAQRQGRWLNRQTTAPALTERVRHAMRTVKAGRRRAFDRALAPVVARHGAGALARFEACLAIQAGEQRAQPVDPRQRPSILYFPGLPATPYLPRDGFPWFDALERGTRAVRDELAALQPRADRAEPVFTSDAAGRQGLASNAGAPSWNGFYFYRHGERRPENHLQCPNTSALLDTLPLARIREHAPEVMFSVLAPGTHILPHRGVTNTRIVVHLPLVVSGDCALVVGGETHRWREGEAVAFDDTYEHEAWNRGDRTRVVLILDVWHPQLTPAERDAVAALVAAMGDFNRAAGL